MAQILLNMFENSIPVSVIILMLLLLRTVLNKRYTAKWQYWVWIVITVRLLIPFDISIPNFTSPISIPVDNYVVYQNPKSEYAENDYAPITPEYDAEANPSVDNTEDDTADRKLLYTASEALGKSTIALSDVLCAIWIFGAFLLLAVRAGGYIVAKKKLDKTLIPYEIDISESLRKLGLDENVPVYCSDMVTTPVLSGIFRPTVIIPENSQEDVHLQVAIHHELVHFKRYDVVFKLMLFIVTCIYWYNPFVWLMSKMALEDIELSCDESIYKKMNSQGKNIYGESILKFAANRKNELLCATSFSDNKQTVATRIKHIFDENRKRRGAPALAVVIAVIVISGVLVTFTGKTNTAESIKTVPEQAQNFIDVYCSCAYDDNYWNEEKNYLGFVYLYYNKIIPQKYVYTDPWDNKTYCLDDGVQNEIYAFMMADKVPEVWSNAFEQNIYAYDYLNADVKLKVKNLEYESEDRFTVTYSRTENNVPVYDITFVMEKQIVDTVPQDLEMRFVPGQEIWRIKSVYETPIVLNKDTQTVEINSLEDFLAFAEQVRENSYYIQGNTYILNADIDLSGVEFEPMFNKTDAALGGCLIKTDAQIGFNATFDGNGHTISNLKIVYDCSRYEMEKTGWALAGLFGAIGENGVVQNLNIENAYITYTSPDDRSPYSAGIIAGNCSGSIVNCTVQGTVDAVANAGGIVGYLSGGSLRSCMTDVNIKGCTVLGAMAGHIHDSCVSACTAKGTVTAMSSDYFDNSVFKGMITPYAVGGFAGHIGSSNIDLANSDVALEIFGTGKSIGAFSGTCDSTYIYNSKYNAQKADNRKKVGYYHGSYSENEYCVYELNGV